MTSRSSRTWLTYTALTSSSLTLVRVITKSTQSYCAITSAISIRNYTKISQMLSPTLYTVKLCLMVSQSSFYANISIRVTLSYGILSLESATSSSGSSQQVDGLILALSPTWVTESKTPCAPWKEFTLWWLLTIFTPTSRRVTSLFSWTSTWPTLNLGSPFALRSGH